MSVLPLGPDHVFVQQSAQTLEDGAAQAGDAALPCLALLTTGRLAVRLAGGFESVRGLEESNLEPPPVVVCENRISSKQKPEAKGLR